MFESTRMKAENEEIHTPESDAAIESEMNQPRWSVTTHEAVAVSHLTYEEALDWMEKLASQKISGLCIITDEAAFRIAGNN